MRKSPLFSAVLTLFLLVPASITWAQTVSSQKGLTTITFSTKFGNIKVYLPDDIRPGDIISGSVKLEPAGYSANQLQKSLDELLKRELKIGDPKDPKQIAQSLLKRYQANASAGYIRLDAASLAYLSSVTIINNAKTEFTLPLELKNPGPDSLQPFTNCTAPPHALTASPLRITGSFDGDASNTRCSLNNKQLEIIAESPRQCIVKVPESTSESQLLKIEDNYKKQNSCEIYIKTVNLDVSAGKLNLRKGEKTFIKVQITGLRNLTDTAFLSLNNKTTGVVKLLPANFQSIPILPADTLTGTYSRIFDVQSLQSGSFSVDVNLNLPGEETNQSSTWFDLRDLKNESGYPGSYGNKENQPCEPEGATIKWRWHKSFACEIAERKVLPCGHTKEGNDVYEKLKELLEELELDKATDIGEKMHKAFSIAKSFSYSIHVIRKWVDYDIEYKCVNGRWQSTGGVYVKHGTDDLGWHFVEHLTTNCWLTFNTPADEQEFEAALETALRKGCK